MAYNVAIASSDGKVINQHFGRATQFLIFEVDEGKFKFQELRETKPFCNSGKHDDNQLLAATEGLADCKAVLVSQIGSGAATMLRNKGIESYDVRDFIEDALVKLIKYYAKIDRGK
jgi:nitrogen fixation protein NifX